MRWVGIGYSWPVKIAHKPKRVLSARTKRTRHWRCTCISTYSYKLDLVWWMCFTSGIFSPYTQGSSDAMNTDDDYLQATAAAYDQIAQAFRSIATPSSIPDNLSAYGHSLIAQVGTSGKLIDIGCGVGNNMSWFAKRGTQVVGIDLSMGMLQLAQQETDRPLDRMSMLSLGFADHTFAAAWCCASLLHLPKDIAPSALSEITRVLKPSGLLMLSVQVGDSKAWNGGYVEGVQRFFARYRLPEMTALLQGAGFAVIKHREEVNGDRTWLAMLCQVQK